MRETHKKKTNITSTRTEQVKYKIKMADTSWTGESKVTRPSFNGKRKNFLTLWTKFKAFTNVEGFADLLKPQKNQTNYQQWRPLQLEPQKKKNEG